MWCFSQAGEVFYIHIFLHEWDTEDLHVQCGLLFIACKSFSYMDITLCVLSYIV